MSTEPYNYAQFTEESNPGDNILTQIQHVALDQQRAEADIARLQEELEEAKTRLNYIKEKALPELMEQTGLDEVTTKDGIKVILKDKVFAHISETNKEQAHAWMNNNGHSNLIKRQFVIDFNKDEESWAKKFAADLGKRKKPVRCKRTDKIHASTLVKFVGEMLEQGIDLPQDLFGVHRRKVTNIKIKS